MIAVVGSGIHGTFLQLMLVRDLSVPAERITAVDPFPEPLAVWDHRLANCRPGYLRSPASHSLDSHLTGARRWIENRTSRNRFDHAPFAAPYHRPAVSLFRAHAEFLIERYLTGIRRVRATVRSVARSSAGSERPRFHLDTSAGRINADLVFLAPGQPAPYRPINAPHVYDEAFDLSAVPADGSTAVVGAGLAAVQAALHLEKQGARVHLFHDRPLSVSQFDSDPCFIGPRCRPRFQATAGLAERRAVIARERRAGSLPPDALAALNRSSIAVSHTRVHDRRELSRFDQVVCATGFAPEVPAPALVRATAEALGAPVAPDGFPAPDESLRWADGVFVSGGLADLVLGPPARNIIGAHLARRSMLPLLRETIAAIDR